MILPKTLKHLKTFQTLRATDPDPNQNVTDPQHWFCVLFFELDIVHRTNKIV
jgi:hypothetical protein